MVPLLYSLKSLSLRYYCGKLEKGIQEQHHCCNFLWVKLFQNKILKMFKFLILLQIPNEMFTCDAG